MRERLINNRAPIEKARMLLNKIKHEIYIIKKLIYYGLDEEDESRWIDRLDLLESREGKIKDFIHFKTTEFYSNLSIIEVLIEEFKNRCDTSSGLEQILCYQSVVAHLTSLLPRERNLQRLLASDAWDSCLRIVHDNPFSDPNVHKEEYLGLFLPEY